MDSKKQIIINTATKLFAEQGFDKTSISQIVDAAQVSKGLVYHHFKNKDDLLRSIVKSTTERMIALNQLESISENPKVQLGKLIKEIFEQLENEKEFYQFNLNILFQPALRNILHDLINERSSLLYKQVFSLFKRMNPKDAELDSYLFLAEIDGIAFDYLSVFENYPLEKLKSYILEKYGK